MKDVSFWCVVLSIVVIFIIHHILSNTFEGLENEEEEASPEYERSEMIVEVEMADAPSPVSCIGSWSSCDSKCEKRYTVTTAKVGDGIDCPYQSGEIESCDPGEGECKGSEVVDGVVVEDGTLNDIDKTLKDIDETPSVSPEKLDICIGGANYLGPNTDPGGVEDYKGCDVYNDSEAFKKQKCNNAYQMDINGNYTQCELDTNDNTCKPKPNNCKPELSVNGLPFCKHAMWIPHSKDVFDCDCEENTTPGKHNSKVNKWEGSTRCLSMKSEPNFHITDCGIEGSDPPTSEECRLSLSSNPWFNDQTIYSYLNGIHTLNLEEGKYLIEISGGSGGTPIDSHQNPGSNFIKGKGAILKGMRHLSKGSYNIIIGQKGGINKGGDYCNYGGGGGGGSFFWMDKAPQPLIVAGGGGGQGISTSSRPCSGDFYASGGNASLTENGSMPPIYSKSPTNDITIPESKNSFGTGGENGSMSNGGLNNSYVSKGWNSIKTGILSNIVGAKSKNLNYNGQPVDQQGGFGGGGISSSHAGGAGGGYSGGGVINRGDDFQTLGGGGGGSRFDTNYTDKEDSSTLGYNDGGGYIKIWGPY